MEPIDVLRPTREEIKEAIANYQSILKNSTELISLFNQGQWFSYTKEHFDLHSLHVHAYPGKLNGQLVFLMIPSAYDHADTKDIENYVQLCPVVTGERSNRISSKTALARIQRWEERHTEWIPAQVHSEYGIFQAFNISSQDFEEDFVWISLGLVSEAADLKSADRADLIVANDRVSSMAFDDFVQPVPPYSPFAASNSFYLFSV